MKILNVLHTFYCLTSNGLSFPLEGADYFLHECLSQRTGFMPHQRPNYSLFTFSSGPDIVETRQLKTQMGDPSLLNPRCPFCDSWVLSLTPCRYKDFFQVRHILHWSLVLTEAWTNKDSIKVRDQGTNSTCNSNNKDLKVVFNGVFFIMAIRVFRCVPTLLSLGFMNNLTDHSTAWELSGCG